VSELIDVRAKSKTLEKLESELKGRIGLLLGDAAVGMFDGNEIVSWKNQTRTSFDQKRFEQEHPALADKFRKESNIRIMKTKGAK
jgi:predicted phage-related endonuclease